MDNPWRIFKGCNMPEATSPNKICFRLRIHVLWDLGNAILRNLGNHLPKHKTSHPRLQGVWSSAWRRLPPRSGWELRSSGILHRESSGKSLPTFRSNLSAPSSSPYREFGTNLRSRLQVRTDVSGQPIGPVFKSLPTFLDNLSVHSVRNYHYSLRNCPEEAQFPCLQVYLLICGVTVNNLQFQYRSECRLCPM